MRARVVVLGGGHGVAAVVRALRRHEVDVTVIVTVGDDGGSSGALHRLWGSPAVGDLRRSLIALAGDRNPPGRALGAPLAMARFGEHPLGNLVLCSLAKAFGDLETASRWLTSELGLAAQVLPATLEPVSLLAAVDGQEVRGESAIGAAEGRIARLGFDPERPEVSPVVTKAVSAADWLLLAPGSLYTSVLAASAVPDIAAALAASPATSIWICDLEPQTPETADMSAVDHLAAIERHGVRPDFVLYDPAAGLHFTSSELAALGLPGLARPLMSAASGRHDPALLAAALRDAFDAAGPRLVSPRSRRELFSVMRPMGAAAAECDIGISNADARPTAKRSEPA
jgi:uncharacterized cofD-like protein